MAGNLESDFLKEEFHAAFEWLVKHGLTRCVIFSRKACHQLLSWSRCLEGPYTVASEKYTEQHKAL